VITLCRALPGNDISVGWFVQNIGPLGLRPMNARPASSQRLKQTLVNVRTVIEKGS
jgi:hypothetical protein